MSIYAPPVMNDWICRFCVSVTFFFSFFQQINNILRKREREREREVFFLLKKTRAADIYAYILCIYFCLAFRFICHGK